MQIFGSLGEGDFMAESKLFPELEVGLTMSALSKVNCVYIDAEELRQYLSIIVRPLTSDSRAVVYGPKPNLVRWIVSRSCACYRVDRLMFYIRQLRRHSFSTFQGYSAAHLAAISGMLVHFLHAVFNHVGVGL